MQITHQTAVRQIIREEGKQASPEFFDLLNHFVERKIREACKVHNGGRKRLDASVAGYVGIK